MTTYTLKFSDDGIGVEKKIMFEAEDAGAALIVAHGEAANRSAELWSENRKLCVIRRTGRHGEIWRIDSAAGPASPANPR